MALRAKRALSCLLTVLMLLMLLPMNAFAAGDPENPFGIEGEGVTATEISENEISYKRLSEEAEKRAWGLYLDLDLYQQITFGRIHSAYHITSTDPYVTITMDTPTQVSESNGGDEFPEYTVGWAVLALIDREIVTYPTTKLDNDKLQCTVRLGEKGTDLALACLVDASEANAPIGDYGTLTLVPEEIKKDESLGYVRPYKLIYTMSEGIKELLQSPGYHPGFDLTFYLSSKGLKIDAESVSFDENSIFELDSEETGRLADGSYKFTVHVDIDAWSEGSFSDVVGISYAAPNVASLLFEGEMHANGLEMYPNIDMSGCVPLALTVVKPPEDVEAYHKIAVTQTDGGEISPRGVEGEVWVKEDTSQTFTIKPDKGYHIEDVVVNDQSQGAIEEYTFEKVTDDNNTITATFAKNPAVTITPADLTIYEGGDAGYEGVVDEDGQEIESASFPEPLFKITMPEGSEAAPTELTFTNSTTSNSWNVEVAGTDSEGTTYYRLVNTGESSDPIRVQFIDEDGNVIESDTVTTTDEVFDTHKIAIFSDENDVVTAAAGETDYNVTANTGTLTVRAVQDTDPTSEIVTTVPTEAPSSGAATAVAPTGTTYTIGETGVPVSGGAPSLLFDSIIENAGSTDRTEALEDRIQTEFGADTNVYEIKYLDLVDANNGNAWIKASEPVDIYWGYPTGTDQDTKFMVVHFKDLHRDGTQSGFEITDIESCDVETIQTVNTAQGIKFSVQPGQFSPFALVDAQAYTIKATADDNGSISPNGSVTVTEGDDQTFTITPNNGYHIEDVLVDGASVGAVRSYTFTDVQANHTITATFERDSLPPIHYYTITATAGEGGAIAPDGTVRVAQGADRTFTISAAEGYVIADVLVDGESIGAVDSYTFENVRQNHTIEARFQPVSGVADPDDTGVSDWLNTDDHLAYLDGYPDNTFQPEEDMTRAEAAQMFYNLLRDQDVDTTVSFTDVAADAWYAEAVNTLATLEIVDGVGDNRFAPERTITRAEFTTMAMRFCQEIPTGENIFSDVDQDDWFYDYVVGSIQYGWINGYPDGTFRPNDTITRAEVTTIANRMLGRAADEAYVDGHQDQLRAFPDVTKGYWAYYDITEATNAHTYTQDSQGEDWTGLA